MRLPRFRLRTLMIAVAVVALMFGGFVLLFQPRWNRLNVENRSGQPISLIQVMTGTKTVVFKNVPDAATVSAAFPTRGADKFAITGIMADGTPLRAGFGFSTAQPSVEFPCFTVRQKGELSITARKH